MFRPEIIYHKKAPFQYVLNGCHVQLEVVTRRDGTKDVMVMDGQCRQPILDYVHNSPQNREVVCSHVHQLPKAERVSFAEFSVDDKIGAMQVACAEAKIREENAKERLLVKALPPPPGIFVPQTFSHVPVPPPSPGQGSNHGGPPQQRLSKEASMEVHLRQGGTHGGPTQ